MSRQGTAWSVKGVDQATRDIARRASLAAGVTIGEWIDQAIRADAELHGGVDVGGPDSGSHPARSVADPAAHGRVSLSVVDGLAARLDAAESRLDAAMRPIAYALQDIAERLVELEGRADAARIAPPEPEVDAAAEWDDDTSTPGLTFEDGTLEDELPADELAADELAADELAGDDLDGDEPTWDEPQDEGPAPEPEDEDWARDEPPSAAQNRRFQSGPMRIGSDLVDPIPVAATRPPQEAAEVEWTGAEAEPVEDEAIAAEPSAPELRPAARELPAAPPADWEPELHLEHAELANAADALKSDAARAVAARRVPEPEDADLLAPIAEPQAEPAIQIDAEAEALRFEEPPEADEAEASEVPADEAAERPGARRPEPIPPTGDWPAEALGRETLPTDDLRAPAAPMAVPPPEPAVEPLSARRGEPVDDGLPEDGLAEDDRVDDHAAAGGAVPAWLTHASPAAGARGSAAPHPRDARRRRRWPWVAAAAVLLLAAGGAAWLATAGGGPLTADAVQARLIEAGGRLQAGSEALIREAGTALGQMTDRVRSALKPATPEPTQQASEPQTSPPAASAPARPAPTQPATPEPAAPEPAVSRAERPRVETPRVDAPTAPVAPPAVTPPAAAEATPAQPAMRKPAGRSTAEARPTAQEPSPKVQEPSPKVQEPSPKVQEPSPKVQETAPPPAPPLPPTEAAPTRGTPAGAAESGRQVASAEAGPSAPSNDALLAEARAGDPRAQYTLATRFSGATPPDYAQAANWFREAAIQGVPNAQYNLGVLYERGLGVPQDDTRALLWYHSAAEQGHPLAQYNLGVLYSAGRGIPLSYAEAARWFRRAADQGVPAAIYNLAVLTEGGLGVQRDPAEAERLLRRAAELGHPEARKRLAEGGAPAGGPLADTASTSTGENVVAQDVMAIQRALEKLGLYEGPVDGIVGPKTRDAISRYQRREGLPVTGLPSASLRHRLVPQESAG